ncbi:MAG: tRNA uridine-5-carboxymethylaminomethyl(34) synthesis GTPase MnmE [Flavobacterium sp.]
MTQNTIVALATPKGSGALAIIRLSGEHTFSIIKKFFSNKTREFEHQRVYFGNIKDEDIIIDEVLISFFKGPKSFTGENTAEISCHASPYIIDQILKLCVKHGATYATPGEYSMRAFLNGKIDLTQAEAIADLIASENKASHEISMNQLRGGVSYQLQVLREELIHFTALIELELDFSEEDVEFVKREDLLDHINKIQQKTNALIGTYQYGNAVKNGIPTAIVGQPNAGKSSWMNALMQEDIAIVSDIAGTTRDKIETELNINGIVFRFIDTAGIRVTNDTIEKIGVEKAFQTIDKAQLIVLVFDISQTNIQEFEIQYQEILNRNSKAEIVIIANKSDLILEQKNTIIPKFSKFNNIHFLSAHQIEDVEFLKIILLQTFEKNFKPNDEQVIIHNQRHYESLQLLNQALSDVVFGINSGLSGDLLSHHLREALLYLGNITGNIEVDRDILGTIFGKFCIGK